MSRGVALVTGTTGFVGGHLAKALGRDYEVYALNRTADLAWPGSSAWDFAAPLPPLPDACSLVLHAASPVGAGAGAEVDYVRLNVSATAQLLEYAVRAKAQAFVFVSSLSVYGARLEPCREDDALCPQDAYACSKAAGEFVAAAYSGCLRILCLRIAFPYGPGQRVPRLVPRLAHAIAAGQPVVLNGPDGHPDINPLSIDDLVEWTLRLLACDARGPYNMAGLETVSIRALAEGIGHQIGIAPRFQQRSPATPVAHLVGDASRAMAIAGFTPRIALAEGLARALTPQSGRGPSGQEAAR